MKNETFDEAHVLHQLRHFLPSQLALKDFVHHNSLHAYQHKPFFEAIFEAKATFGIQVTFNVNEYRNLFHQGRIRPAIIDWIVTREKGEEQLEAWKQKMLNKKYEHPYDPRMGRLRAQRKVHYKIDVDNFVHPLLFRIVASYLDQGIALWHFPFEDKGLLEAVRTLEANSFTSFFQSARVRKWLQHGDLSIPFLLNILVGNERYYDNYIYDQQFSHKGWSGIIAAIEGTPDTLLYRKKIAHKDFILLELLLEIDVMDSQLGNHWKPLATFINTPPVDYWSEYTPTEGEQVLQLWQQAFEWDYYDHVLAGLQFVSQSQRVADRSHASFQAIFCVDDREDSFRRHIEAVDPDCETYGAPGFFGAAFYFQPFGGKFYEKNAPVAIQPRHLIKEIDVKGVHKGKEGFHAKASHTPLKGFLLSLSMGLWAPVRLLTDLFRPRMKDDIADAFAHMNLDGKLLIENTDPSLQENGLQIGYTVAEMADVVYGILSGIGLNSYFAPIVYIVAHGSSSANNPHHGAHDCGACSGRPGAVNARVFAFMANHAKVREILAVRGLLIPEEVQFVGAMHDTASDELAFYDEHLLTPEHALLHQQYVELFENSLDLNAKERARRFASININRDIKHVRKAIKHRSVSYFEPRPELGHGTNALCYIGGREKIKGLFLDRRAFLQSYDYRKDPSGEVLAKVLEPLPGVCGGINLEYYFSRMDIEKMGAGTKLPHNVVGLIGVVNSSDGDLRPGLPLQMIENHDPVRLMMMIEHQPEIVMGIIQSTAAMAEWFDNEWIH
ncbi:MAG: DUF2309 domain-containing protein [Saprospiraceae bacterium]